MSFTTVRVGVGRVVLVAGILVLLFIPYLLWGTGLATARSQHTLRQQFAADQRRAGTPVTAPADPAPGPPIVAPTTTPPPLGQPVGIIGIPKIGLSMVVVEGTGEAQLRKGPGHYPGTPLPGQAGNAAIAGHRTTYLHPFYDLNELRPGDDVDVTTLQGRFTYRVTSSLTVAPGDVSVVGATTTPELTLTTCNPRYSATQRLVVHARLASSTVAPTATQPPASSSTPASAPPARPAAPAPGGSWALAAAWGAAVAAAVTAWWVGLTRLRGWRRAVLGTAGTLACLVVVFFFFGAVAPLLPPSY